MNCAPAGITSFGQQLFDSRSLCLDKFCYANPSLFDIVIFNIHSRKAKHGRPLVIARMKTRLQRQVQLSSKGSSHVVVLILTQYWKSVHCLSITLHCTTDLESECCQAIKLWRDFFRPSSREAKYSAGAGQSDVRSVDVDLLFITRKS